MGALTVSMMGSGSSGLYLSSEEVLCCVLGQGTFAVPLLEPRCINGLWQIIKCE